MWFFSQPRIEFVICYVGITTETITSDRLFYIVLYENSYN